MQKLRAESGGYQAIVQKLNVGKNLTSVSKGNGFLERQRATGGENHVSPLKRHPYLPYVIIVYTRSFHSGIFFGIYPLHGRVGLLSQINLYILGVSILRGSLYISLSYKTCQLVK